MGFLPPEPVAKVLQGVYSHSYVLPAIQREFIWNTGQVRMLFDSLLRGYPIGSFLFWKVDPNNAGNYVFYDFLTHYHERNSPYATARKVPPGQSVIAILDGQQRITALNIGLYGSHAERRPYKWAGIPDNYPTKHLFLNLLGEGPEEELGMRYDFQFLSDDELRRKSTPMLWYRVGEVLQLADSGPAIMEELERRGLQGSGPFHVLFDLYKAVRETPAINAYLEELQDADKVLDIFVRVNSAGTVLSYSDLLLSMATNQWEELDAREEVRSLLTALNNGAVGFGFSKDSVLKAGLMLIGAADVGFKVSNFTRANMSKMEERWHDIRSALIVAKDLLAAFGFSEKTLSASSVLIPLAYYVHRRNLDSSYVASTHHTADREAVRSWVLRSQIKRGIWGSGLDTLLTRLRDAIREHGAAGFPVADVERAMAGLGKSLGFDDEEVSELCDLPFGHPRTFAILALLYPGLDLAKQLHQDHIFPRSTFTPARLIRRGVPSDQIPAYMERFNTLPNLQLLDSLPNTEKQAVLPSEWLSGPAFSTDAARTHYMRENDLDGLPVGIDGYLEFHEGRRERIERRLRALLGLSSPAAGTPVLNNDDET